jgi:hypothetical protein
MPTAAKLIAALAFAALGYILAELYKPLAPAGLRFGFFSEISALLGLAAGWLVMGKLAGRGYWRAWGGGVRTAAVMVVWAIIGFALFEMVRRGADGRYGPSLAKTLTAGATLMVDFARTAMELNFLATMAIGGAVAGIITEWAKRNWG